MACPFAAKYQRPPCALRVIWVVGWRKGFWGARCPMGKLNNKARVRTFIVSSRVLQILLLQATEQITNCLDRDYRPAGIVDIRRWPGRNLDLRLRPLVLRTILGDRLG